MVFCGKPSKGCNDCRARKVKCDQAKPACARCVNAGRVCAGYRDPLNLSFRDESEDVVRKASIRRGHPIQRKSRRPSPTLETSASLIQGTSNSTKTPPLSEDLGLSRQTLSVSIHDQATCFFFYNFVVAGQDSFRGDFSGLPSLLQCPGNGALSATIASVGMAGLANTKAAPQVMIAARKSYARALRLINTALQHPVESTKDQTLSAIILLSLFEIITCSSEQSIESWTNHIDGCSALLKFRGPEQLRTRSGFTVFMQCRSQILISSLQRELKVNFDLAAWGDISQYYHDDVGFPAHRLSIIVARFSDLRAALKAKDITDPSSIVLSLLSIDAALLEWLTLLPPNWAYKTIDTRSESDTTYGSQSHIYGNVWMASVWNNYRCVRMLCNESILRHLGRIPPSQSIHVKVDYSAQARLSRSLLNQLAYEICSSVTFQLGPSKMTDGHLSFQCIALYGFYLLWPLYIVGSTVGTPNPLRLWVIRLLDGIGYSMGIQQASALAQILQTNMPHSQDFSKSEGQDSTETCYHENTDAANVTEEEV